MEYSLRHNKLVCYREPIWVVLILILMEYSLRLLLESSISCMKKVLILILMEYSLRQQNL